MRDIGHNNPPDMTETAASTAKDLSAWMAENPVVETEESAREAKVFIDRGGLCIRDLEDERDKKVRPLNEQVKEINTYYRGPRETLQRVLSDLERRLSSFLQAEKRKREAAAAEAWRVAQEAEQRARELEAAERAALESINHGELGVDIASHIVQTDAAIKDANFAARKAALAERETKVKIGGGFHRAIGLRETEVLIVDNPAKALKAIGMTDDIRDAILKGARLYRRLHNGKVPDGIKVEIKTGI